MKKTVKKRAFVSAVAMLIVSAIVLTSSTFAWFSMSKKASVDTMDLTVTSPEGILISANAKAWTSSLTPAQIFETSETIANDRMNAYAGNHNFLPVDLKPVSSAWYRHDNGYVRFLGGSVNDSNQLTTSIINQTSITADNAGFVAFDLFVKLAEAKRVYFGTSEFKDTTGGGALTALRVGFQRMGTFTINDPVDTITAAANFNRAQNTVYEVDAINRSDDASSQGNGKLTTKYLDGAYSGTVTDKYTTPDTAAVDMSANLITSDVSAGSKYIDFPAGITKYRVFIWIEGNDVDCRNSIGGSALSVALTFTID